jgi:hypothetical protein
MLTSIRPLELADRRSRRVSGRNQISNDGRHLIDGVAFGRPFLRANGQLALINGDATQSDEPNSQLLLKAFEDSDDEDDDYRDSESEKEPEDDVNSEKMLAQFAEVSKEHDKANGKHAGMEKENAELEAQYRELRKTQRRLEVRLAALKAATLSPEQEAQSRRKRKRSEGLGIGNAGLSSALLSGESTPDDILHVPKKRRITPFKSMLHHPSRHSSRSSTRSVRFAEDQEETPATLRMVNGDTSDEESDSDSWSSSSESDKENKAPALDGSPEVRCSILCCTIANRPVDNRL